MSIPATLERRFPDFLCIGAQKAGTTWLDSNLRRHPGIWMPWIKELQYFNHIHIPGHRSWTDRHRAKHAELAARRLLRKSVDGPLNLRVLHRIAALSVEPVCDEWYAQIFAHSGADQICGEVTPEYSLLPPEGVEHVYRLNRDMKIIFLIRDPVDRCWSHLRMLANGKKDFDFLSMARSPDVLMRSDFHNIIERWISVFGAEKIYVTGTDVIAANHEFMLRDLCQFLGVPMHVRVGRFAHERVFVGEDMAMPASVREVLEYNLAPVREAMRRLVLRGAPVGSSGGPR